MADTKISQLTELSAPVAADSIPIVDASTVTTKRVTISTLDGRYVGQADVGAKGDIYVATANDAVAILSVGLDETVLMADSATSTGAKWATGEQLRAAILDGEALATVGSPAANDLVLLQDASDANIVKTAQFSEFQAGRVEAVSTVTKIDGPITQAAYDALTPSADTLYVIVG